MKCKIKASQGSGLMTQKEAFERIQLVKIKKLKEIQLKVNKF